MTEDCAAALESHHRSVLRDFLHERLAIDAVALNVLGPIDEDEAVRGVLGIDVDRELELRQDIVARRCGFGRDDDHYLLREVRRH